MTAFNFTDWLSGVESPAEGVTVYQKPGLIGKLMKAREAFEAAKGVPRETAMGESTPESRLAALQAEVAASKTVWYVSPLTREVEAAVEEEFPEPDLPVQFDAPTPMLADRATEVQSQAFLASWAAYRDAHHKWEVEHAPELVAFQKELEAIALKRGAARIAASVTYIETFDADGNSTTQSVTLTPADIVEAEKRLGAAQIGLLVEALDRVSRMAPKDPDPFE